MGSLNDSLRLVLPVLPTELVPKDSWWDLGELASVLAPLHCAGFECRLGRDASRVDLQQRILASDEEPHRLRDHIQSTGLASHEAWRRIRDFCDDWVDASSLLHRSLTGCWLAFDVEGRPSGVPVPSVFLELAESTGPSAERGLDVVRAVMTSLRDESLSSETEANLRRCLDVRPEGAALTYVGIMLARHLNGLRVVVGPMNPEDVESYLERLGCGGTLESLARIAAPISDRVDAVSLSLDIGPRVYPRVGLECFPGRHPVDRRRWVVLFDSLVRWGLCMPEKRDALLTWPGYIYPTEAAGSWPDNLVAESLLRPPARFSVLGRRLNHVKIVSEPTQPLEAKAYFGFGPLWLQPKTEDRIRSDGTARRRPGPVSLGLREGQGIGRNRLKEAVRVGVAFLTGAREGDGWWRDFRTVEGGSDEWVSGYVGVALADLRDPRAHQAARETWGLLAERRRPLAGWGYNAMLPADADSTAWGLRLAKAVADDGSVHASEARRFLDRHFQSNGGLASYTRDTCPLLSETLEREGKDGLCVTHTCVTAAAAAIAEFRERCCGFLEDSQCPDGHWKGYWWGDHEYTTALAAEALAERGGPKARERVQSAIQWATGRVGASGAVFSSSHGDDSVFAAALCIRTLLLAEDFREVREPVERAVRWLLACQNPDGSWPPSARMRVPPFYAINPEIHQRGTFVALDLQRVFTTATVLSALEAAGQRLDHSSMPV